MKPVGSIRRNKEVIPMRRFHGARRRSEGQILAMFAGGAILLILITGLVIDGGNVFLQRRDSQNSADIGAMAGTKRLADYYVLPTGSAGKAFTGSDNVYTKIATRMGQNDCSSALGSDCSWTARYVGVRTGSGFVDLGAVTAADAGPPGFAGGQKALGVTVNVTKTPRTYLLGVIGQSTWTVKTLATAVTGSLPGAPAGQLLPIGLTEMPTQEGALYALTSGADGPGNFGWLSWNGSNNSGELAAATCTPNNPAFTLPYQFAGDPGKTNSSDVRACLQQWVDNQQTVLIPIVLKTNDPAGTPGCSTGANGNNFSFCVVALAAFVITGYSQPAVDQINGRFVGTVPYSVNGNAAVPGPITAPPTEGSTLYALGLAQ
jgi:Flp pilus assembly protein TadG